VLASEKISWGSECPTVFTAELSFIISSDSFCVWNAIFLVISASVWVAWRTLFIWLVRFWDSKARILDCFASSWVAWRIFFISFVSIWDSMARFLDCFVSSWVASSTAFVALLFSMSSLSFAAWAISTSYELFSRMKIGSEFGERKGGQKKKGFSQFENYIQERVCSEF